MLLKKLKKKKTLIFTELLNGLYFVERCFQEGNEQFFITY